MRVCRSALGLGLVGLLGCFDPTLPSTISCAEDGLCPSGYACDPVDSICRTTRQPDDPDAGDDASSAADASDDAAPRLFCRHDDVVLCLEFEQNTDDGSDRGNTVMAAGGAPRYTTGHTGDGLELDGSFALSIIAYRPGTTAETLELWMTPSAGGFEGVVGTDADYRVGTSGNVIGAGSGPSTVMSGPLDSDLHHVAVRVSNGRFTLFVDGAEIGDEDFVDGSSMPTMVIGSDFAFMSPYIGRMDSLRVWTRALGDSEILSIAQTGDI